MNAKFVFLAFAVVVCQVNGQFPFGNRPGQNGGFFGLPNMFQQIFRPFSNMFPFQQQQQQQFVIPTPVGQFLWQQRPPMPAIQPIYRPPFQPEIYPQQPIYVPTSGEYDDLPYNSEEVPYESEELYNPEEPIYEPEENLFYPDNEVQISPEGPVEQEIYPIQISPEGPIEQEIHPIQISPEGPIEEEYPGEEFVEEEDLNELPQEDVVEVAEEPASSGSQAQSEAHSETQSEVEVPEEVVIVDEEPALSVPLV